MSIKAKTHGQIMSKGQIYFDGECDFCKNMVTFLELDKTYKTINLHTKEVLKVNETEITKKSLEKEIHLITNNNQVLRGGFALKAILLEKSLIPNYIKYFLNTYIGNLFIIIIYKFVSANRSFFNYLYQKSMTSKEKSLSEKIVNIAINILPVLLLILLFNLSGVFNNIATIIKPLLYSIGIFVILIINAKDLKKTSPISKSTILTITILLFIITSVQGLFQQNYSIILLNFIFIILLKTSNRFHFKFSRIGIHLFFSVIGFFILIIPPTNIPPKNLTILFFWIAVMENPFFGKERLEYLKQREKIQVSNVINLNSALIKLIAVCFLLFSYLLSTL